MNAYIMFQVTYHFTCFFLCLQFKQKICPLPSQDDDDDDDTSVPSSTPEPAPPTASSSTTAATAAPVPSTSAAGVSSKGGKKMVNTLVGEQDILQLLLQRQEKAQEVAGDLRQFVRQVTGPTNTSAWGTFLYSNLPLVLNHIWPMYLTILMENYMWALNESDNILANERQQQQQCQVSKLL